MEDSREKDQDRLPSEKWVTEWEDQCIQEWQNERGDLEERMQNETELSEQKLWLSFQNSAASITQLYKGNSKDPDGMKTL